MHLSHLLWNIVIKLLSGVYAVLLIELIYTASCLSSLLLTGIKRMALGTDFHVDLLLGGTGNKGVAAVAGHRCLIIFGMDSFFHRTVLLSPHRKAIWVGLYLCVKLMCKTA